MGMLRERGRAITRLLPAAVMNTEYRANKRLYEFTEREGGEGEKEGTKRAKRKTRIERSSRKEEIERGREEDGEDACREASPQDRSGSPTGISTFNNIKRGSLALLRYDSARAPRQGETGGTN